MSVAVERYQLDATKITNFHCTRDELELQVLFWICAAGKNGVTSAKCLCKLLNYFYNNWYKSSSRCTPFRIMRALQYVLPNVLKRYGIGCYNVKSKKILQLVNSNVNLKKCTLDELENYLGPKSARCFLIHTRPNQQYAGLDRHILRHMKDQGYDVPQSTPSKKRYREIEKQFLQLVKKSGKSVAEYDLDVWKKYSGRS